MFGGDKDEEMRFYSDEICRYLESEDYNIHGPEYLVGTEDSSIYPWPEMKPVFFIPQVEIFAFF